MNRHGPKAAVVLMSLFRTLLIFAVCLSPLSADVTLHPLFSNHAVLQKSAKVPIWGWADPGEKLSISLDSAMTEVTAGPDGKWLTYLDLGQSGAGPFTMEVVGKNRLIVKDVVVGSVWIASGQSNMGWTLANTTGAQEEIAASANPSLRWFAVKHATSATPSDSLQGQWVVANPNTAGQFTAVGYYFGKTLQNTLETPIGLINATWGGTPLEAWSSADALDTDPELKKGKDRSWATLESYPQRLSDYLSARGEWEEKFDLRDRTGATVPLEGWKPISHPIRFTGAGAVWIQRSLPISSTLAGRDLPLHLRNVRGSDQVYWNGERIAAATPEQAVRDANRNYVVPGDKVQAGTATLSIRLFDTVQDRGIQAETILLAGATPPNGDGWSYCPEFEFTLSDEARAAMPTFPGLGPLPEQTASHLFNAMIHPILPYAIEGVIWYQGESNTARAFQYRKAFPLLISDWRNQWGQGDFPFYFCQLANFYVKDAQPRESTWAELREAQDHALSLPNTGRAVLIDAGEEADIHPRDKKTAGERLASLALANHHGRPVAASGPTFKAVEFKDGQAFVSFAETEGGLVARKLPESYQPRSTAPERVPLNLPRAESQIQGFAIAGENRKWVWADASIQGDGVVVSSPEVPEPIAIRYAWGNNPTVNLYNGAGFPAVPFRSDIFPISTETTRY